MGCREERKLVDGTWLIVDGRMSDEMKGGWVGGWGVDGGEREVSKAGQGQWFWWFVRQGRRSERRRHDTTRGRHRPNRSKQGVRVYDSGPINR
jgi:hypothetical protein